MYSGYDLQKVLTSPNVVSAIDTISTGNPKGDEKQAFLTHVRKGRVLVGNVISGYWNDWMSALETAVEDGKSLQAQPLADEAAAQVQRYLLSFLHHGMAGQDGLVLMVEGPHDIDNKPWYRGQAILHEASRNYHRDVLYARVSRDGDVVQVRLFDQKPELLSDGQFQRALKLALLSMPAPKAAFNDIYLGWQATVNLKEKTATVELL